MKCKNIIRRVVRHTLIWRCYEKYTLRVWNKHGRSGPPPHVFKQHVLKKYAQIYGLTKFVETGTFHGAMVDAMRSVMKEIYSIELDHKLCEQAKQKFKKFKHIHIMEGNSSEVLEKILPLICEPCLFWLDAHYSGCTTACGEKESPINEELMLIINHNISNHVVLIDDARCFSGNNGYPTIAELKDLIHLRRPDWKCTVEDDIIRLDHYEIFVNNNSKNYRLHK